MSFFEKAQTKIDQLAKPPGSLGSLEKIAAMVARGQKSEKPSAEKIRVSVFAGDHGVARAESVSPYPPTVTGLMVKTFLAGKAAINTIAVANGIEVEVINCGVEGVSKEENSTKSVKIHHVDSLDGPTANLKETSAMTATQLESALEGGRKAALRAKEDGVDIAAAGEMGIGNTTPATALFCKFLSLSPSQITGPGTGLDAKGVMQKAEVISAALERITDVEDPKEILMQVGGFEIASMAGFFIELSSLSIPVLLDGFIATAAACAAIKIDPSVQDNFIPATKSAEPAHANILKLMGMPEPILDLSLRLGEGTGACLAAPIVRASCSMMNNMASLNDVLEGKI